MKKAFKCFGLSNIILLAALILYASCGERGPQACSVPSAKFGTLNVEAVLYTGSLFSDECPRLNNIKLLDDLQSMGAGAFVKEKADDNAKYVIEVMISGGCSDGIWTKFFKKGEFTLTNIGSSKVRFNIPNIPLSSTNEYTIMPRILTPCVGNNTTCRGKTNYRVLVGGSVVGFKVSNPVTNGTFEIRNAASGNLLAFIGLSEEDCQ